MSMKCANYICVTSANGGAATIWYWQSRATEESKETGRHHTHGSPVIYKVVWGGHHHLPWKRIYPWFEINRQNTFREQQQSTCCVARECIKIEIDFTYISLTCWFRILLRMVNAVKALHNVFWQRNQFSLQKSRGFIEAFNRSFVSDLADR